LIGVPPSVGCEQTGQPVTAPPLPPLPPLLPLPPFPPAPAASAPVPVLVVEWPPPPAPLDELEVVASGSGSSLHASAIDATQKMETKMSRTTTSSAVA
jgi:hypothetical protein